MDQAVVFISPCLLSKVWFVPLPCPREMQRRMEEMKEFIPNIESRHPKVIRSLLIVDLPRFKGFKRQGQFSHGKGQFDCMVVNFYVVYPQIFLKTRP